MITIEIKNRIFNVDVMTTPTEIQNGMMGKKFDNDYHGMLFVMSVDKHCFWMKNCIIPLDIIFIDGNKISKIYHNCPPCKKAECESYCGFGSTVLELKGNTCKKFGIKEGDYVSI